MKGDESESGMKIGGRTLGTISKAVFGYQHYKALWMMMRVYQHPLQILYRYLFSRGAYPFSVRVKTPLGGMSITLYSHHDLLTVNEIFCRLDYSAPLNVSSVVDFGSNIGISALYFLTRNSTCRVKLFEPLPSNIEKLRKTLQGFEKRYSLETVAIGVTDGEVEFGYEPSGRYGGIGKTTLSTLRVPCRDINSVIRDLTHSPDFNSVDILKIDIEGYETAVIRAISPELLPRIQAIFAEVEGPAPDLKGFTKKRYGSVVRWHSQRTERSTRSNCPVSDPASKAGLEG